MNELFGNFDSSSEDSDSSEDSESTSSGSGKSRAKARHVGSFARFVAKDRNETPKAAARDAASEPDKAAEKPAEASVAGDAAGEPSARSEDGKEPAIEVDVPLDEVTPEEQRQVAEQLLDAHRESLSQEMPPTGSEQEAAHVSHAFLLDAAGERMQTSDASPEQVFSAASAEVSRTIEQEAASLAADYQAAAEDFPMAAVRPGAENEAAVAEAPTAGMSPVEVEYHRATAGQSAPNRLADPNVVSVTDAEYFARQAEARGVIFGGIVGYLVGRRHGRLKTEKRMGTAQRKLEKRVASMDRQLTGAEQQVRSLATEKFRAVNELGQQQMLERMRSTVPGVVPEARPETPVEVRPVAAAKPKREVAPSVKRPAEQPPEVIEASIRLKNMNTKQLLMISERVVIEGQPLKEIYEAHQITEPGLRHILIEYVRGGDVKKALSEELAIKQMTFERDPQIRDRVAGALAAQATNAAGVVVTDDNAQTVASNNGKSGSKKQSATPADKQKRAQAAALAKRKSTAAARRAFERAWVVMVVLLAVIATILYLR